MATLSRVVNNSQILRIMDTLCMDTVWIQLDFQPNLQRNQPPPRLIQRGVQRI